MREEQLQVTHTRSRTNIIAAAAIAAAASVACGGNGSGSTSAGTQAMSGNITISGSSTVEPVSALVAEKFRAENPGVSISVNGPGTTDGFALFCEGELDIADASREIKDEEIQACEDNGIEYVELTVGIDGISVVTSPENDAVDCLGFEDLYALLGPESEGFDKWSDANELAEELGAKYAPYPDEPLVITAPGEESGTWGSFIELALEGVAEERGIEVATRPDYQSSPNDNVIVQGVEGSTSSLGWVGYAFYEQTAGALKAIPIDGGEGECVAPTQETISDGSYPLSRELYIYVNTEKASASDALAEFVDFYLSDEGLASVAEVGYVDQPSGSLAETIDAWESRSGV